MDQDEMQEQTTRVYEVVREIKDEYTSILNLEPDETG